MDSIEVLTGLDLLTVLGERMEQEIETEWSTELWLVDGGYFTEGCKRSRRFRFARELKVAGLRGLDMGRSFCMPELLPV